MRRLFLLTESEDDDLFFETVANVCAELESSICKLDQPSLTRLLDDLLDMPDVAALKKRVAELS